MIHIIHFLDNINARPLFLTYGKDKKNSKSISKKEKPNVKKEAVRRLSCTSNKITSESKGLCQNIAHMWHGMTKCFTDRNRNFHAGFMHISN